ENFGGIDLDQQNRVIAEGQGVRLGAGLGVAVDNRRAANYRQGPNERDGMNGSLGDVGGGDVWTFPGILPVVVDIDDRLTKRARARAGPGIDATVVTRVCDGKRRE